MYVYVNSFIFELVCLCGKRQPSSRPPRRLSSGARTLRNFGFSATKYFHSWVKLFTGIRSIAEHPSYTLTFYKRYIWPWPIMQGRYDLDICGKVHMTLKYEARYIWPWHTRQSTYDLDIWRKVYMTLPCEAHHYSHLTSRFLMYLIYTPYAPMYAKGALWSAFIGASYIFKIYLCTLNYARHIFYYFSELRQ
jgi:hypothetical protein